ncbi:helix-turn-helix transcriptional regulator [Kineosporiaceae bacterium B12]|nr:helix-turn-helix transcriptional regulator [Kineococcus rubinsiae]
MRVLAHPTRLTLLGELRSEGPATVGGLSRVLDEAPGSVSYHLGRLVDAGLVEEAPDLARDRRERWWRAVHQLTTVSPTDSLDDPERHAASTALRREFARRHAAVLQEHLDAEASLPRELVAALTTGDRQLRLTTTELRELSDELEALVDRWQARSDALSADGERPGTHRVALVYAAVPRVPR